MKLRIPARTVEACDLCEGTASFLEDCDVCGKKYCRVCQGIFPGCMIQPDVCRTCSKEEPVKAIVKKFAAPLAVIVKQRTKALKRTRRPKNASDCK